MSAGNAPQLLPRHLRQRLYQTPLASAIHRILPRFEYDPGRPWFLIQSAADADAQSQHEEKQPTFDEIVFEVPPIQDFVIPTGKDWLESFSITG